MCIYNIIKQILNINHFSKMGSNSLKKLVFTINHGLKIKKQLEHFV
jgi:hypothetical protein